MATFRDQLRVGTQMVVGRSLLRVLTWTGDPLSGVLARKPVHEPYPGYARVRARGELTRSRLGIHATASHGLINEILRDQRFGVQSATTDRSGAPAGLHEGLVHPLEDSFLSQDPPSHTRLRRLVAPAFTPRALRQRADRIETLAHDYLDELAGRDGFDLIDDFAVRVPIQVICDLLGVPGADHRPFIRWGAMLGSALDGTRTMAELRRLHVTLREMDTFFAELIERRRREPGDDLVSRLVHGEEELSRTELVATVGLLLIAGFETTVNLIGNAVLTLRRQPAAAEWFAAHPDRAADLVEEVLRFDPPVQHTGRITHEPVTVGGVALPRNAQVILLLAGANRDPAVFDRPDEFDPERPNNREHLAFSAGIHYCVGAPLAKMEAAIALRALTERFPRLQPAGPVRWRSSRNIRGVLHLPMRGEPASAHA